jgi:nitrite reductase/ring-hydroxylating ferredoxin subunit
MSSMKNEKNFSLKFLFIVVQDKLMVKIFLANYDEIPENSIKRIDFEGRPAIIIKYKGRIFAYIDVCTHLGGPLYLDNDVLRCEWHDSTFDIITGKAKSGPAPSDSKLIRLPITIEDGKIYYVYEE